MRFLSADSGRIGRRRLQGVLSAVFCLAAVTTTATAFVLPESARRDVAPVVANDGWLNLTVIHTNDVHSRVDPANEFGVSCTDQDRASGHCYGGTARHKTVIERLRKANQHSLLLDGGDEFQGTLFYTYYKGNVTAQVMNELGYDLGTIGNHEWDNGPDNLGRYWPKLNFPIVCANIDFTKNPELGKLVKPYHIFEDLGVAVIGYITNTTGDISNVGPSVSFTDPIPAVQKYVDELEAKGIKRILALSHNGYGPDMELAAGTHGVDLIVGGHSHSYLGDPSNPLSQGPYPTIIKNLKGENTLIVQAFCWGRYIGHLDVAFNPEGKIVSWKGEPILVENSIPANPRLLKEIDGWRHEFEEWGQTVLGEASDSFDQDTCKQRECTMGNLVADAMLQIARTPSLEGSTESRPWTDFAFINSGGIRSGLPAGNVTIEMIMTTSPFGNGLVQTQFTGSEILNILEAVSAGRYKKSQRLVTSNIQTSGLRFVHDSSRPLDQPHLIMAEYQDRNLVWHEIKKTAVYNVCTLDFILKGGDNIVEVKDGRHEVTVELLDKALMDYIESKGKISPYLDGRIKNLAVPMNPENVDALDEEKRAKLSIMDSSSLWPIGTPEHVKSQYPGGFQAMVESFARLQHAGAPMKGPLSDNALIGDIESRQEVWA
ncbi:5'-nucleotidase [Linnemannia elongata]|nr:5'-nucleotidase [Linnemannia elongata]